MEDFIRLKLPQTVVQFGWLREIKLSVGKVGTFDRVRKGLASSEA
jgi:hypothetical protein